MFNSEEERIKDFDELCEKNLMVSAKFRNWLIEKGFFRAPASTKYHGAYEGGLYDHCKMVYSRLEKLTEDNHLIWQRAESPFIVGMFHDVCKIDQYKKAENGIVRADGQDIVTPSGFHYEYNTNTYLKGHGAKSVMLLSMFMSLTEEEVLCVRYHMGAYEKEEWPELDLAIRKFQNVLWSHHADMLASKVDDV